MKMFKEKEKNQKKKNIIKYINIIIRTIYVCINNIYIYIHICIKDKEKNF